jgi:hypothetical protein
VCDLSFPFTDQDINEKMEIWWRAREKLFSRLGRLEGQPSDPFFVDDKGAGMRVNEVSRLMQAIFGTSVSEMRMVHYHLECMHLSFLKILTYVLIQAEKNGIKDANFNASLPLTIYQIKVLQHLPAS